jgi:ADP-heptose:LPS heptosyltransferase
LRESYPEAEITWIVEEKAKDLVIANPNLDRVITLPKAEWKENFKENKWATLKQAKNFFNDLKEYNFDITLDVHGLFKSALTTYLSGAPLRVGDSNGREGSPLFYNKKVELPEKDLHQVDKNLYLASGIGAESEEVKFDISISKDDKEKIDRLLSDRELIKQEKLVAINPFTSWQSKGDMLN